MCSGPWKQPSEVLALSWVTGGEVLSPAGWCGAHRVSRVEDGAAHSVSPAEDGAARGVSPEEDGSYSVSPCGGWGWSWHVPLRRMGLAPNGHWEREPWASATAADRVTLEGSLSAASFTLGRSRGSDPEGGQTYTGPQPCRAAASSAVFSSHLPVPSGVCLRGKGLSA